MKHLLFVRCFLFLLSICIGWPSLSQKPVPVVSKATKYMLCIGINNYLANTNPATCKICKDRVVKNLDGCLNDVDTISKLFIKYYDFKAANIHVLKDQQASRAAILDSLKWLQAKCKKGDYVVFFYSGHGSYEYETAGDALPLTGKTYRNTILPADFSKPGIPDINSAELNTIFSGFVKKGVVLTVITDCCHSATNTRGSTLFEADLSREVMPLAAPAKRQGNDAIVGATLQLDKFGALTIGACQDNETAEETHLGPVSYGAFTLSLCRAINEWSQAPVEVLLERTISRLRILNKQQTPNMEAGKRLGMNLAGTGKAQARKTSYPIHITGAAMTVPAGFTDDISNGDILTDIQTKDSIQVSNVGLSESTVLVINQSKKLKAADITALHFMVLKKLPNPDPPLKIFLGSPVNNEIYSDIMEKATELLQQKNIHYTWMTPALDKSTEAVIFYQSGWKLNRNKIAETVALQDLDTAKVNALMNAAQIKNAYLQLPPPVALTEQLMVKLSAEKNRNIKVADAAAGADFVLAGHLGTDNTVSYGWEKTIQNSKTADYKKESLPAITDFFPVLPGALYPADSLTERVNRLSVLANWLSMKSPPADKSMIFPYHLAINNLSTKTRADDKNTGRASTADTLDIRIENDGGLKIKRDSIKPLFIYVMSMDPKGNTQLVYPTARSSILTYPNSILYDTSYYHLAFVKHNKPGVYHYFFIALREPVSDRNIFTRRGVVRGDAPVPEFSDNPLEALLNDGAEGQRGDIKSFDHWILKTVDINTGDKTANKN